jgi:hypothetical protein
MTKIGEKLRLPVRSIPREEAEAYFSLFAMFAQMDNPVSSTITRRKLGWQPIGPTTLESMETEGCFDGL